MFRIQFGSKQYFRLRFDWSCLLASNPFVDMSGLESSFTLAEVKAATFDLSADKAQGRMDSLCYFSKDFGMSLNKMLLSFAMISTYIHRI